MKQLFDAVSFMHAKGVVHRDLNPKNVFVVGREKIKVIDFNVSKLVDHSKKSDDVA